MKKKEQKRQKKNIAELKKQTIETDLDATAKEKLLLEQKESLEQKKQRLLEQTPAKVDDAKVDSEMRKKLDDIEKAGGSWKDLFKKGGGGKLGALAAIVGGSALVSEDAYPGDFISTFFPLGFEPTTMGGRGRGLKHPDSGNILTLQDERDMQIFNPELYEQMETTFKRDQAYEQEQKKIKKTFREEEQMKELLADPLGAID